MIFNISFKDFVNVIVLLSSKIIYKMFKFIRESRYLKILYIELFFKIKNYFCI